MPVRVAAVERARVARPVRATARLASKAEVRASFKVGGIVAAIAVDEGAQVRRGQVVARLATAEVDAAVEQARQGLAKAERDLARAEQLFAGRAATGEQVDDVTTGVAVARAQLRAARFNADHAVIRAPQDGRVLRRLTEVGELVAPGQPVLVLSGDDAGWIARAALADRDVVRLADGDRAQVRLAALPGVTLDAVVAEVASAATPPAGTYEVELRLLAPPPALRSGLVADVTIAPTPTTELALVPAVAVRDGDGTTARVWVPGPGDGASPRQVEIAFFDGERVAIAAGLDGVATVVTDGAAYLGPTSRLEIVTSVTEVER
ncbi:MAG: efflux RND transporter periplasmic adaptor subunit [Kofleriaceae bacterium]